MSMYLLPKYGVYLTRIDGQEEYLGGTDSFEFGVEGGILDAVSEAIQEYVHQELENEYEGIGDITEDQFLAICDRLGKEVATVEVIDEDTGSDMNFFVSNIQDKIDEMDDDVKEGMYE